MDNEKNEQVIVVVQDERPDKEQGKQETGEHRSHHGHHHGNHHHHHKKKHRRHHNSTPKQKKKVNPKVMWAMVGVVAVLLIAAIAAYLITQIDKLGEQNQFPGDISAIVLDAEVPAGVKEAALAVVNKALSHEGDRIFRFMVSADAHQKNDHVLITKGTRELGQAQGEILKLIGVDFVAFLGDAAWSSSSNTVEEVRAQIRMFKQLAMGSISGEDQFWLEGNHDDAIYAHQNNPSVPKLGAAEMYAYFYSENTDVVYDPDHYMDGYCYKDYVNQKVRVICLNTEQGDGEGGEMAGYQLKWFAETALNMEGKEDWSVITMAHHPLDFGMASLSLDSVNIVDAFINGRSFCYTTADGTAISIDYADKNCQYVGHFHGHTHAFSVVRMQKYVTDENGETAYEAINAWEIGIPNACYARNNQNLNNSNPNIARFATPVTYEKEDVAGKRTAFDLVTLCLEEKKIYLDCYGAGVDRVVSYDAQSFAEE